MKYKIFLRLSLTMLILFTGCALPQSGESPTPTLPPSTPITPSVLVRIQNQSDFDMEQLLIHYPDKNNAQLQLSFLAAGETSAYFPLPEIYQSAAVEATIGGQRYRVDAPDLGGESPITNGTFLYVLTFRNDNLQLEFQLEEEGRQAQIEPLVSVLVGAGATVVYESSVPRDTIFDRLWGQSVTQPELLSVNNQRLWVYQFADREMAQAAADTIQPGGTHLVYTRTNGTEVHEFLGGVGAKPMWWQWEQFVVLLGEFLPADDSTTALISQALGRDPLHAETLKGTEVQLRIANLSGVDFERVIVNVAGRETNYGALPAGSLSAYLPQNGAYRYAGIEILAGGETYEAIPTDFVGETPLAAGTYTYVLELAASEIIILHLADDTLTTDPALQGRWYWSRSQLLDGTFTSPESYEGQQPYLEFTDTIEPNQGGLRFGGNGGCNAIFGSYYVSPDRQGFVTGGGGSTAQDCGNAVMASETFLQEALTGIVYYQIDGETLSLYIPTGETLTFVRE